VAAKARKTPPATPSLPVRAAFRLDRARALLIAILVACATLPYLNILVNGFVYDDDNQVLQNPYIRSFHYLKEIFTSNVWSFTGIGASNYYRPMMTLGYLVCYELFGMHAYGFHLASLLLHVLVVYLVFVLAERLTGDRVCAFVAGALFALHPIHSEAVAWVAAVTDLQVTFFYLLTFGLFLALARPGGGRSVYLMAAMGGSFLLALLSKEQAMTLPAVAAVYEHFYRADRSETSTSQKLARYGLLWLVGAAYLLVRVRFLGGLAPQEKFRQVTPLEIVLSAMALVGQYVWKLLWPVRLCAYYIFHASNSLFDLRVLAGLLALLAFAVLFLVCWRSGEGKVRIASFAILWFFATLAPVLNAHWVGLNVFTERYLYLPSVGIAWLAGLGAAKLWRRAAPSPAHRRALVLAGVVVGGFYAARIVVRNRDWNNDIVLYSRTLELSPGVYILQNNLAIAYAQQGALDKAENLWRDLLLQNPDDARVLNNLGSVTSTRKEYAQAAEFFERAVKIKPGDASAHANLGVLYRRMAMPGRAEAEDRIALTLTPVNYGARNELGEVLFEEGRLREAEEQFSVSVGTQPNALAYNYLGTISLRRGASGEAEKDFSAALNLEPDDSYAHFALGDLYQFAGRRAEALREYEAGLMRDPNNPRALAAVQKLRLETGK
jgi:tetratricopeptide (TPR) repeat protein